MSIGWRELGCPWIVRKGTCKLSGALISPYSWLKRDPNLRAKGVTFQGSSSRRWGVEKYRIVAHSTTFQTKTPEALRDKD